MQDGASMALCCYIFSVAEVLNSLQSRAIEMHWCFWFWWCWGVCVCVAVCGVFFFFLTINGRYTTHSEAQGRVKTVLTLKGIHIMQWNRYEY